MADTITKTTTTAPDATAMFTADREKFWESFTKFSTYAVIAVVVLLVLMAFFLG